jgi:hypothetical protein
LVGLILLAICPLYFGHMFINPKDSPFAAAMAVFLLGLVRAFQQYPRPSLGTLLVLALGFGLSIGSRIMAGFGVLAAAAALALLVAVEARAEGWRSAVHRLGAFVLALLPAAVLAYVTMAVVWPWAVVDPLNPLRAIAYFSEFFEKPWHELFDGALITPPDMPRSYVPTLFGLKLPEVFLVMTCSGLGLCLFAAARDENSAQQRAVHLCIALMVLLPLTVTVVTGPAMYNGIRHFVFMLPPLAIAGGLAGAWLAARSARWGGVASMALGALFVAGVALPVIGMVRLHPYEYVWFNHLAGGVRAAQSRFMLDYWGLAFKQAGEALRQELAARSEHPPRGKWKIAVCGPHPPAQVALGEDFEPTWDSKGADFVLMLGVFYCARPDAPQLVEITRDGVVFARAYDIRGRDMPSLFTERPVERGPS